jgi:hypothetical protein
MERPVPHRLRLASVISRERLVHGKRERPGGQVWREARSGSRDAKVLKRRVGVAARYAGTICFERIACVRGAMIACAVEVVREAGGPSRASGLRIVAVADRGLNIGLHEWLGAFSRGVSRSEAVQADAAFAVVCARESRRGDALDPAIAHAPKALIDRSICQTSVGDGGNRRYEGELYRGSRTARALRRSGAIVAGPGARSCPGGGAPSGMAPCVPADPIRAKGERGNAAAIATDAEGASTDTSSIAGALPLP